MANPAGADALTDAGGVGLNLQKAATACINLEMPWNPAVLEQRVGHIYRIGQKHPIDVFNLFKGLLEGNADELRFERAGSLLAVLDRITAVQDSPVANVPHSSALEATQAPLTAPPVTAPAAQRTHARKSTRGRRPEAFPAHPTRN